MKTRSNSFRVGAVIPLSGVAGIYGPSCKACLELSKGEINAKGGIDGSNVELVFIDGARSASEVGRDVEAMLDSGMLDGLVGMHDSDIRKALVSANDGRVIYIYTPCYEGGHHADGLLTIGETPKQQVGSAVTWLQETKGLKSWYFLGSDYSWPRVLRSYIQENSQQLGIEVISTQFTEIGCPDYSQYIQAIDEMRPDAIFFALVGDDSVQFNREFGAYPFASTMARFGPLMEENTLLAIGEENATGIYTAGGYFPSLDTPENRIFKKKYAAFAGNDAPEINTLSVSCYEGMCLLSDLLKNSKGGAITTILKTCEGTSFTSVQGVLRLREGHAIRNIFLARAVNNAFRIVHSFGEIDPM